METASQPGAVRPPHRISPGRVDEKGRLKLPTDFQEYLASLGDKQVFITTFDGRTGRIYPISTWDANEVLLREAGDDAQAAEDLWFVASAYGDYAEIDSQGRLLLPSELRRHLGIENQPVYLQYFYRGHIKIFSQAQFEEKKARAFTGLDEKVAAFEKKGLR